MATLEDRILGEKLQYYCSSSEGESDTEVSKEEQKTNAQCHSVKSRDISSSNTGPKGVIKDWQRFKQLQTEQRREEEKERILLAKKLSLTCRSHLEDERAEEEDVDRLIDQDVLQEFIAQRMREMRQNSTFSDKNFGELIAIKSGDDFLEVVDKEDKRVTVVVHLYEPSVAVCNKVNRFLNLIAARYPSVKFCCFQASDAGLSHRFRGTGVPAVLVYKNGEMIANFVRFDDEIDEDFTEDDIVSFLVDHGILHEDSKEGECATGNAGNGSSDDD